MNAEDYEKIINEFVEYLTEWTEDTTFGETLEVLKVKQQLLENLNKILFKYGSGRIFTKETH
jgi:hypothetical protein